MYLSGTGCYLPLEWFEKRKFLAGPGTVWSVGVMMYHIVCGGFPFTTFTREEMRQVKFRAGLSKGEEPAREGGVVFKHALCVLCPIVCFLCFALIGFKDIVRRCLRPRAEDRPTLEQLQQHSWLRESSQNTGLQCVEVSY